MSESPRKKTFIRVAVTISLVAVLAVIVSLAIAYAPEANNNAIQDDRTFRDVILENMTLSIETIDQTEEGSEVATVFVTMPDLSKLMSEAALENAAEEAENADDAIFNALREGEFETITVQAEADVVVDGDEKTVDESAVKDEVLEEQLIEAVNATVGGQDE